MIYNHKNERDDGEGGGESTPAQLGSGMSGAVARIYCCDCIVSGALIFVDMCSRQLVW